MGEWTLCRSPQQFGFPNQNNYRGLSKRVNKRQSYEFHHKVRLQHLPVQYALQGCRSDGVRAAKLQWLRVAICEEKCAPNCLAGFEFLGRYEK